MSATTTKGGEKLYVHVSDESDKEIDFLYKKEEELSNALKAAIEEQGTQVPNLEASAKSHFEAILNIVSPSHSKKAKELACQFIPKYNVPEEDKLRVDTLKAITEIALFTSENHSRSILPTIYQTLKNEIPEKDATNPKLNLTNIECFLFIFHQLAFKAQGSLNEICGIKIITGQPTDNYGDFKHLRQDMLQRLGNLESAVSPYVPKLEESIKVLKAEKKEENKDKVRMETQILNCAKNILELTRALKKNRPDFISTLTTKPSWITFRKKIKNNKRKDRDGKDNSQGKNKVQKRDNNNNQNKNNQRRIDSSSNNRGGRGRGRGGRGGSSNRGGRRF